MPDILPKILTPLRFLIKQRNKISEEEKTEETDSLASEISRSVNYTLYRLQNHFERFKMFKEAEAVNNLKEIL